MTRGHVDIVWSAMEEAVRVQDASLSAVVCEVLDTVSFQLDPSLVIYVVDKLRSIPPRSFTPEMLLLLKEMSRFTIKVSLSFLSGSLFCLPDFI